MRELVMTTNSVMATEEVSATRQRGELRSKDAGVILASRGQEFVQGRDAGGGCGSRRGTGCRERLCRVGASVRSIPTHGVG